MSLEQRFKSLEEVSQWTSGKRLPRKNPPNPEKPLERRGQGFLGRKSWGRYAKVMKGK